MIIGAKEIWGCDVLEDISIYRPAKQSIRNDYWNIVKKERLYGAMFSVEKSCIPVSVLLPVQISGLGLLESYVRHNLSHVHLKLTGSSIPISKSFSNCYRVTVSIPPQPIPHLLSINCRGN
jgi:hypothetical protein